MSNLNTAPDDAFKAYMKRKLREFYQAVGPAIARASEGEQAEPGDHSGAASESETAGIAMSVD